MRTRRSVARYRLGQQLWDLTPDVGAHPGPLGDIHRAARRLRRRRITATFAALAAVWPAAYGAIRATHSAPLLSGALTGVTGVVLLVPFAGLWAETRRGRDGRVAACRLARRWRRHPAEYLKIPEFFTAGLHARVAAALGSQPALPVAGVLLAEGFTGTLGELVTVARGVLEPHPHR